MKSSPAICFAAILCAGLPSCATDKDTPPTAATDATKAKMEDPKLVGRIASIPADKRFVLIQSYGKWNIGAGTILTTRGQEDRVANLLATGEVLGEFAAADLQSGLVEVGDAVYTLHSPKPVPPKTPAEPVEPAADGGSTPDGEVQKIN